jgi:hypothetical protein
MEEKPQTVFLRYYGISPWEIEVVYNLFNEKFKIIQEEIEQTEENFVSALTIDICIPFSEEFFKWFEFKKWEKVKSIVKEMKRRRGRGNAIVVEIYFRGKPDVRFIADLTENHDFNSAVEKIDFVVELLPYHINEINIPSLHGALHGIIPDEVTYRYDMESGKWKLNSILITLAESNENLERQKQKKFILTKKEWKIIT